MPGFEQGDVVRVPFPYTNRSTQQFRPALVVSDGALGGDGLLLWVIMITSAGSRSWPGDVDLTDDLAGAGLPVASVARPLKIATIDAAAATRLGTVTQPTLRAVLGQLRTNLKLAP